MIRKPVKSSQLKSVGYDSATKTLEIEFTQGGGVYQYANVTLEKFGELAAVSSIGSFFIQNIKKRPDLYPYKKIEAQKPA